MTVCEWCHAALDPDDETVVTVLDPDWREGGMVSFCCTAHGLWYTYAVTA